MYRITIHEKARAFLEQLPEKVGKATRDQLLSLSENPFPKDSELLKLPGGYAVYRLHIGRILTVFYKVNVNEHTVQIMKILTIEQAHKEYRRWG